MENIITVDTCNKEKQEKILHGGNLIKEDLYTRTLIENLSYYSIIIIIFFSFMRRHLNNEVPPSKFITHYNTIWYSKVDVVNYRVCKFDNNIINFKKLKMRIMYCVLS